MWQHCSQGALHVSCSGRLNGRRARWWEEHAMSKRRVDGGEKAMHCPGGLTGGALDVPLGCKLYSISWESVRESRRKSVMLTEETHMPWLWCFHLKHGTHHWQLKGTELASTHYSLVAYGKTGWLQTTVLMFIVYPFNSDHHYSYWWPHK